MRQTVNLNHKWAFSKEAAEVPAEFPKNWVFVNLPHTWNAIDGQDGGNDYYRGTCYYAKQILKSELPQNARYYLEFCGANASAQVYWNGECIGRHDGGYSTFRTKIPEALQDENLLVVSVDNGENETVYPQMADFTFYGGLYRDVNLIAVSDAHFDLEYYGGSGIAVTPTVQGDSAQVRVQVFLNSVKKGQSLFYCLQDRDGKHVSEAVCTADCTEVTMEIPKVHLWHGRKSPYLYTACAELRENGEVLDRVSARFGCRSFRIDAEKGFILNGEPYPLRGVSRHQDRWGLGNALLPEHHEEDMDLICELGATTVRLAHYQHDRYFYDLCDERGLVVWAEIPYISKHMPKASENAEAQLRELIVQNYNHPSIVVWGLSNEITMNGSDADLLETHKHLNALAHELDSTRPTTVAVVSMCDMHDPYLKIPDVISYNHYFGWYGGDTAMNGPWLDRFHETFPDLPIGVSEYGCEGLDWHTSDPVQGDYTEEYQAYYHEELIKQLFTRPYLWATHVWNMFDFGADARNEGGENGQNHKGLVAFDRQYKKDAFYAYKAWLSDEPFVHICGKRYTERTEEVTKVTVYSNLPTVELFRNGESIDRQTSREHFFYFDVPNIGESRIEAVAGEVTDGFVLQKVDSFPEKYRLKEKGAVLNWFDITAPEGYFSLNDKLSEILETDEGKKIFFTFAEALNRKGKGEKIAGFTMGADMLKMLGGFTVLRLTGLLGTAGVQVEKDELLELNRQLNQIPRASNIAPSDEGAGTP